jgi:hypothetical protein
MANKKIFYAVIFGILLPFLFMGTVLSQEANIEKSSSEVNQGKDKDQKYIANIEFLTGYGLAKLRDQGSYRLAPIFVDINFDLKPVIPQKIADCLGLFQFALEPFASYVYDPDHNMEIGTNFLIKIGILPERMKF